MEGLTVSAPAPAVTQASCAAVADVAPAAPPALPDLENDPAAVLALLEPDQTVAAKRARFGARRMGQGLRLVLWSMRAYVAFMLAVVVVEVLRNLRGG